MAIQKGHIPRKMVYMGTSLATPLMTKTFTPTGAERFQPRPCNWRGGVNKCDAALPIEVGRVCQGRLFLLLLNFFGKTKNRQHFTKQDYFPITLGRFIITRPAQPNPKHLFPAF